MKTTGSAEWKGGIKDGVGALSTKSGALAKYPYGFAARFEGKPGSNPEELLGAAHAGCFTMALSMILGEAGMTAEQMDTTAEVTLDKVGDGFEITKVYLTLKAKIRARTRPSSRIARPRPRRAARSPSCSRPRSPSTPRWSEAEGADAEPLPEGEVEQGAERPPG